MTAPHALISLLASSPGQEGWIGNWSPGIGDPTFGGWLTVAAYLVAAWLCFDVYRRLTALGGGGRLGPVFLALVRGPSHLSQFPVRARQRALWLALAVVMLLLGINKQLDLQTALTEMGRMLAREEGWYQDRRRVQLVFILGVAVFGVWLAYAAWRLGNGTGREMRSVLAGAVLIVSFVTIRAASFHHVDYFLGTRRAGFKLNLVFELGGIAFVIRGAWLARRHS